MANRRRTCKGDGTHRKAAGKINGPTFPGTANESESAVLIQLLGAIVTLASNDTGDLVVTGESPAVLGLVNRYIHDKLLFRGRTLSDRLRAALVIAKEFQAEIPDFEGVQACIRNGWVRFLKSSLSLLLADSVGAKPAPRLGVLSTESFNL